MQESPADVVQVVLLSASSLGPAKPRYNFTMIIFLLKPDWNHIARWSNVRGAGLELGEVRGLRK